jgi:multiple sugar transport system ATP-binding protein
MASVKLVNLSKYYDSVVALDRVNLEIADREFLVLVGPSGCGKSTCLRIIAGLDQASAGQVWIGDRQVDGLSPKDRDIAMVFQSYALYPHMSVYDNMAFGLRLRGVPRTEITRRVHEAAAMLGLQELLDRRPAALSGGQRQRVAVGRAVVREPSCFLMDEPLSNLDAGLRLQTRAELIRLHRRLGITTVYVTHDQVEAMTMGDRIAVMKDGLIQQCDSPQVVYDAPVNRFVAGFIGSPPMNFMEATVERDGSGLWLMGSGFRVLADSEDHALLETYVARPVTMGIRPSDISDTEASACRNEAVSTIVQVIEPMGDHTVLYLSLGGQRLVASVSGSTRAQEGQPLQVWWDMSQVHYFDPVTEARLG